MKVVIADEAGFCFGVKRALRLTNRLLRHGNAIQTYGPLIHNQTVLDNLRRRGIVPIDSLREYDPSRSIVIRTHGIPKSLEEQLARERITYLDATCPLVKKIHRIMEKLQAENIPIILVGDALHPEIVAAKSYAEHVTIINSVAEAKKLPLPDHIGVLAQSTLNKDVFNAIVSILKKKTRRVDVFDTICQATVVRQDAVKRLATRVEAVVVIGSKNSSNTRKLVEIASERNSHVFSIESHAELASPSWHRRFVRLQSVGITAGASTPPSEIVKVKKFFQNLYITKEKQACQKKKR